MRALFIPAAALFVILMTVYTLAPVVPVSDSKWTMFETISLLRRGDLTLDEYPEALTVLKRHGTIQAGANTYDYFPPGIVLLAAVPVFLISRIRSYGFIEAHPFQTELVVASLLIATGSLFLFQTARKYLPTHFAAILTLVFALGTQACSTGSRALWQQTGMMALIPVCLFLIQDLKSARAIRLGLLGLLLGLSYVVRPTAAILILAVCIYALRVCSVRQLSVLYASGSLVGICFLLFSLNVFGTALPPYYSPDRVFHADKFPEALAGNLISPARGVFLWSPIYLFSLYGVYRVIKGSRLEFGYTAAVVCVVHWFVVSSFPDWWGGHSVGSRLMSETAPLLAYLLIPFLQQTPARPVLLGMFGCAAAVSILLHVRSIYSFQVLEWNTRPEINEHPERIWDFRDPQFLAHSTAELRPSADN